ncbi:DUF3644 domain-containing protein [Amycolatopsis sp. NPDC026612]|uniref:DUF3644 domain-containing protein n=1 Tax=Amycolatopsis sp. NPDC026612 TaxID=3155466 RepID=UPI003405EC06
MVDASRDEAQLAVRLYNDPAEARSFEGFVVHMHLAWLYLLHGEFTRDSVDFRYWRFHGRARRVERIDGEPKRWDLATCVRHRWSDEKEPVRANLAFFIGLRKRSSPVSSGSELRSLPACVFRCSSGASPIRGSERCAGCARSCPLR